MFICTAFLQFFVLSIEFFYIRVQTSVGEKGGKSHSVYQKTFHRFNRYVQSSVQCTFCLVRIRKLWLLRFSVRWQAIRCFAIGTNERIGWLCRHTIILNVVYTEETRETREGWPRLSFETEVNGDSKSTNERGLSLVGSLGLSSRYNRFLFCLGCSSRPRTKYFFSCPHRPASYADSRAGSPVSGLWRKLYKYSSPTFSKLHSRPNPPPAIQLPSPVITTTRW